MNYLTEDEEVKRLNELRENWALDRFFDMRSAEEKQQKTEKLEMAKKLLEKNIALEIIIELQV